MPRNGKFDVVVWGATGFTGRLVAEYLAAHRPEGLRWAIAGRNDDKLREVGAALTRIDTRLENLPRLVGDSGDRPSLDAIAAQTRVVCTTVGPYAQYGSDLVAACVDAGTDYCDLTGEVHWVRRMIDEHHRRAAEKGARIVCSCGFDSIPSDLGCWLLQESAIERHGAPLRRVVLYVDRVKGGFSGGTASSMRNLVVEAVSDPSVRRVLADPYALNPEGERQGPDGRDDMGVHRTEDGRWTAPFVMGVVNERVVRRSNALLGYPYGREFSYNECMRFPAGARGLMMATAVAGGIAALTGALVFPPTRAIVDRLAPASGEGPSQELRETGFYRIRIEGSSMAVRVEGDQDPGYGSTSKMLAESALCLALDETRGPVLRGGVLTPASAMGVALLERLQRAGILFEVE